MRTQCSPYLNGLRLGLKSGCGWRSCCLPASSAPLSGGHQDTQERPKAGKGYLCSLQGNLGLILPILEEASEARLACPPSLGARVSECPSHSSPGGLLVPSSPRWETPSLDSTTHRPSQGLGECRMNEGIRAPAFQSNLAKWQHSSQGRVPGH